MKTTTQMSQAPVGGQLGINGEYYQGGQFLPNWDGRVKGSKAKPKRARRVEIEPGVWVESTERSIYTNLSAVVDVASDGSLVMFPLSHQFWSYLASQGADVAAERAVYQSRVDAYNRGERFLA